MPQVSTPAPDQYCGFMFVSATEIGDDHVVCEQLDAGELGNHLGARHASALYTAAYAAASMLSHSSAAGDEPARLRDCEVTYRRMPQGRVRSVATITEPDGRSGLCVAVRSTDDRDAVVVEAKFRFVIG